MEHFEVGQIHFPTSLLTSTALLSTVVFASSDKYGDPETVEPLAQRTLASANTKSTDNTDTGSARTSFDSSPIMSGARLLKYPFRAEDCAQNTVPEVVARTGEIQGILGGTPHYIKELVCNLRIRVPNKTYLSALVQNLMVPHCKSDLQLGIYNKESNKMMTADFYRSEIPELVVFSPSNVISVVVRNGLLETRTLAKFRIRFQATDFSFQHSLNVVKKSSLSGYITPIGFHKEKYLLFPFMANATHTLLVPEDYVAVTSLPLFELRKGAAMCSKTLETRAELRATGINGTEWTVWSECNIPAKTAQIHQHTRALTFSYAYNADTPTRGFKMLFSFHPNTRAPDKLPTGLFNCSVPHYSSFKLHVHCNLKRECEGGEDEGEHCPFSPPGCQGMVGYKGKCYRLIQRQYLAEQDECRQAGGRFAMMKTKDEWEAFLDLFRFGRTLAVIVLLGMKTTNATMPDIYRGSTMWEDGTVNYERTFHQVAVIKDYKSLRSLYFEQNNVLQAYDETEFYTFGYSVCEFDSHVRNVTFAMTDEMFTLKEDSSSQSRKAKVSPPEEARKKKTTISSISSNVAEFIQRRSLNIARRFTVCPGGHLTHSFLVCVSDSQCGARPLLPVCKTPDVSLPSGFQQQNHTDSVNVTHGHGPDMHQTSTTAMFECDDGRDRVHYTLVCDFRPDCGDGSDEAFCQHRQHCAGFTCTSGECVGTDRRCDLVRNCVDGSDEENCDGLFHSPLHRKVQCPVPPPAVVDFVYGGYFTQTAMEQAQSCPHTHFQCPGEASYCLPVYVRCNGVYDCAGHEDEEGCDSYTCPGYYRCRGSSVCVHADHLCDGLAQCPKRDDELLCDRRECPLGCQCQGLAFVCHQPFPSQHFSDLRYLDGTGSSLGYRDLTEQHYMVWLSLAQCGLRHLPDLRFPNLRTLDLSDNLIVSVSMESVHTLTNLRDLRLAGNPLTSVLRDSINDDHINLKVLDLSLTNLKAFDSSVLAAFRHIQYMNLSHSLLDVLSNSSFNFLPALTELDIRGCPLTEYPVNLFRGLSDLSVVFTSDYRLCCDFALPERFDSRYCIAPEDAVSSCQDLVKSGVYRVLLWVMAVLAVAGNVGCWAAVVCSSRYGLTVYRQGTTATRQGLTPDKQELTPNRQGMSEDRQERTPDRQGLTPSRQGLTPDRQGLTAGRQGPTPDRKWLNADRQGMSEDRQERTPDRQGLTPSGQGLTPYRQGLTADIQRLITGRQELTLDRQGLTPNRQGLTFDKYWPSDTYRVLLASLSVADLLMGVCLVIVIWADAVYSGQYAVYDRQWRSSIACTVACFLSEVSFSVSVSTVLMITLERCMSTCERFDSFKNQPHSITATCQHFDCFRELKCSHAGTQHWWCSFACLECVFVWSVGFLLAGVALFLRTSEGDFHASTAACIPTPARNHSVWVRAYYFGAVVVVNLGLSCLTIIGLVLLKLEFRKVAFTLDETKRSQEVVISRRFITMVTSNTVCTLAVCLVGVLDYIGVSLPPGLSVFVFMLVMPVRSALNPVLYALSLRAETQREETRWRLLRVLTARMVSNRR